MSSLRAIQEQFQNYLLKDDKQIIQHISGNENKFIEERLAIYGVGYYLRLLDSLAINFPNLKSLAGDELFEQIGADYLATYPSKCFTVRYFGDHLSEFLAENQFYAGRPELSEMAKFEWALCHAYDAADAEILTIQELTNISQDRWPSLRFILHPSVQLVSFKYNIPGVWQALNQNVALPPLNQEAEVIWSVWRKGIKTHFWPNTKAEAWIMESLREQKTFAEICEGLCQWMAETDVAQYAVNLLAKWLSEEMFSNVS